MPRPEHESNDASISEVLAAGNTLSARRSLVAAASTSSRSCWKYGLLGLGRKGTRAGAGTTSLRSSRRLGARAPVIMLIPVTFSFRLFRLLTRLSATGSPALTNTIGISDAHLLCSQTRVNAADGSDNRN